MLTLSETRTVSIQPSHLECRPHVTANLRGIRYARETVRRSRTPSSTTTPMVAKKTKNCLVCGPVATSNVRRHIDQTHVPWFVSPEYSCWRCQRNCGSAPFTSVHSGHDQLMTTDERLGDWVCRINVLLKELLAVYHCEDLEELLLMVQQRIWYPTEFGAAESERQFLQMRMWAFKNSRPVPSEYQLCPPMDVSALVHRAVMRQLFVNMPEEHRHRLLELELQVTVPSPGDNDRPLMVDSHCHLDRMLLHDQPSWNQAVQEQGHLGPVFQYLVCSLSFASTWRPRHVDDLLEDSRVFFTVGLHPHETSRPVTRRMEERQTELLQHPRCRGFGEVGLDYTHPNLEERECQQGYLRRYLPLVTQYQTRVVVHCREGDTGSALADLLSIFKECVAPTRSIYVHHFVGTVADVEAWSSAFPDIYFGIPARYSTGDVEESDALLKVPLRRLLLESDSPYILRQPFGLTGVIARVSHLLNMSPAMVAEMTRFNACRFYGLPN